MAHISGTNLNDVIAGTALADTIDALDGHDFVFGGSGDDEADGGAGNDVLIGDEGDDTLFGNANDDVAYGGSGADALHGGDGDDILDGGEDDDVAWGGSGNDTLRTSSGADILAGDEGDDAFAIAGNGVLSSPDAYVAVSDRSGADTIDLSSAKAGVMLALENGVSNRVDGQEFIIGGPSDALAGGSYTTVVENAILTAFDDIATGNGADNRIEGGGGNDALSGGLGSDRLTGDIEADTRIFAVAGPPSGPVVSAMEVLSPDWSAGTGTILKIRFNVEIPEAVYFVGDPFDSFDDWVFEGQASFQIRFEVNGAPVNFVWNDAITSSGFVPLAPNWDLSPEIRTVEFDVQVLGLSSAAPDDVSVIVDATRSVFVVADQYGGTYETESQTASAAGAISHLAYSGGDDTLDGGGSADTMAGGKGNDFYVVDSDADSVVEFDGEGVDTVQSSVNFVLPYAVEILTLTGTALNGDGNLLANVLTGNENENRLDGRGGADRMAGGDGNDTYIVDDSGDTIVELSGQGTDAVESSVSAVLGAAIENLTLTSGDIYGTGNALNNVISGSSGRNVLNGGGGSDQIDGAGGNDTLLGGAGDDILSGAGGGDYMDGGIGSDQMAGGDGNDTYVVDTIFDQLSESALAGLDLVRSSVDWGLAADFENLTLIGSAITGGGNTADNAITGNAIANTLDGGGGNDLLNGGGGNDTLTGGEGNDRLDGGTGNDQLSGGTGNDTYVVDSAGDTPGEDAGAGTDVVLSSVDWSLADHFENLTLGGAAVFGAGNGGNNVIYGNALANILSGGGGNDSLTGNGGDDSLAGDDGNDVLNGGTGDDQMAGGGGNDTLAGGVGSDILDGGDGGDYLTGEADADRFVFALVSFDRVTDFAPSEDKIVVSAARFGGGLTAGGAVALVANGAPSASGPGGQFLYDVDDGRLWFDADGQGGLGPLNFARLLNLPVLAASDFDVIA